MLAFQLTGVNFTNVLQTAFVHVDLFSLVSLQQKQSKKKSFIELATAGI